MNKFSLSVVISFQPNFLRRDSTSEEVIPWRMSAVSHSSGTVVSCPSTAAASPFFQNCGDCQYFEDLNGMF